MAKKNQRRWLTPSWIFSDPLHRKSIGKPNLRQISLLDKTTNDRLAGRWFWCLGSQPAGDLVIKLAVVCPLLYCRTHSYHHCSLASITYDVILVFKMAARARRLLWFLMVSDLTTSRVSGGWNLSAYQISARNLNSCALLRLLYPIIVKQTVAILKCYVRFLCSLFRFHWIWYYY